MKIDTASGKQMKSSTTQEGRVDIVDDNDNIGIYALILAFLFVIECSGRKSLHAHGLLYGVLPPWFLSVIAEYKGLCTKAALVTDSMIRAEIPPESRHKLHNETVELNARNEANKTKEQLATPSLLNTTLPGDGGKTTEDQYCIFQWECDRIALQNLEHSKHTPSCCSGKLLT